MRDPVASTTLSARSTRYRNPSVKPRWYKSRQNNMTRAQKAAEARLWPIFGLAFAHNTLLDLDDAFAPQQRRPTVLEIGCGAGEALVTLAAENPSKNFVGVDWYRSGLATCLSELDVRGLDNVRLVRADAFTALERGLPPVPHFDEVLIYFPDPWRGSPERRIVRPEVVRALAPRMRPSGVLHVATDVEGYAEHVRDVMASDAACWRAVPCAGRRRPSTKYERDGLAAGRTVDEVCFVFDG